MFIKKIRSQRGESITEVLVAALIGSLGILLFAMMVSASTKVALIGIKKISKFADVEEKIELEQESVSTGNTVNFRDTLGNSYYFTTDKKVNIYGNTEDEIFSYKIN